MKTILADYTQILPPQLPVRLLLAAAALMENFFWVSDDPDWIFGWNVLEWEPIEELGEDINLIFLQTTPIWPESTNCYADAVVNFLGFQIQFEASYAAEVYEKAENPTEHCKALMLAEILAILAEILAPEVPATPWQGKSWEEIIGA